MSRRVCYGGGHAIFTPTTCFVVVLALGLVLGVEHLPANSRSLAGPVFLGRGRWQLLGCDRDAQAPSAIDKRMAFLKGAKNMTAALHQLWEGA